MKTKLFNLKTKSFRNLGFLFLILIISLLNNQNLQAQRGGENSISSQDVKLKDGMLIFKDRASFEKVYKVLEERAIEFNQLDSRSESSEVVDNQALLDFEREYPGYTSLRSTEFQREDRFLQSGGDPSNFEEDELVMDEVLGTLINSKKQMQVENSLFLMVNGNFGYEIIDGSQRTLKDLLEGKNSYELENVRIIGEPAGDDCKASFSINGSPNALNYSFAFTGSPTPISHPKATIGYFWTFGDGNSSSDQNPSHVYNGPGTYNVCLIVEMTTANGDYCKNRTCQEIVIIEETEPSDSLIACALSPTFIYNETGVEGKICFTPTGEFFGQNDVISYLWSFGDGATSTDQFPCHTFVCDLEGINVSLTVETAEGCTAIVFLPISITSFNCCERNAKNKGDEVYTSGKKFKWKQKSHHILWFDNKIVVTMKHYKIKPNGNWKKEKTHLKVQTYGDVFTEDAVGCGCTNDYPISATETEPNSATLRLKKPITRKYKTRKGQEWGANYYVKNSKKLEKTTPVACD